MPPNVTLLSDTSFKIQIVWWWESVILMWRRYKGPLFSISVPGSAGVTRKGIEYRDYRRRYEEAAERWKMELIQRLDNRRTTRVAEMKEQIRNCQWLYNLNPFCQYVIECGISTQNERLGVVLAVHMLSIHMRNLTWARQYGLQKRGDFVSEQLINYWAK